MERIVPDPLLIVSIILGIISCIIGALGAITLFKLKNMSEFDSLKYSSVIMLLNLVVAEVIKTGMYVISMIGLRFLTTNRQFLFCQILSFFGIWSNSVTLLCILMLGLFAIYQVTRSYSDDNKNVKRKIPLLILLVTSLVCWIFPFFTTLIPAFYNVLGPDQNSNTTAGWCWISTNATNSQKVVFMMLFSRGFELFVFLINLTLYLFLRFILRRKERLSVQSGCGLSFSALGSEFLDTVPWDVKNDSRLLFLINLSILFSRIWGIIRAILVSIIITNGSDSSTYNSVMDAVNQKLLYLQAISVNLEITIVIVILLCCSQYSWIIMKKIITCRYWRKRGSIIL